MFLWRKKQWNSLIGWERVSKQVLKILGIPIPRPVKGASKLTGNQNCSIFNNLKGLDYKGVAPFYILERYPNGR
jgi:hypothetical protein